jgi:hypothetical protein
MTFIARLFGYFVLFIFIGAVGLSVIKNAQVASVVSNVEGLSDKAKESVKIVRNGQEELIEKTLVENTEIETAATAVKSEVTPVAYRSELAEAGGLEQVLVGGVEELRDLIYKNESVLVVLDNEYLMNPFLGKGALVVIRLTGYDENHFYSDGSEIGSSSFTYVAREFFEATVKSEASFYLD